MRNLIAFVIRYHFFLLFFVLEIISFVFISKATEYQSAVLVGAGNRVIGRFYTTVSNVTDYFKLQKVNEALATENAMLRQMKSVSFLSNDTNTFWVNDTMYKQQYKYLVAKVVHNTVGKRNNYIMLSKGRRQGIHKDMAVITSNGIVGTVVSVSDNFSWVMSVLNKHTRISGKIVSNNQMGTVVWNGVNSTYGTLTDIPAHVKLRKGDTIVSSGYSHIFPPGIMMGTIQDFRVENGEHFYVIPFRFSVDFNSLQYVYVVQNILKEEQQALEKTTEGMKDE